MKRICILILACLFLTACQQPSPDTIAKESQATIDAGVKQTLAAQGIAAQMQATIDAAIAQTVIAVSTVPATQAPQVPIPTNTDNGQITKNTPAPSDSPVPLNSTPKIMFTYVPPLDSNEDLAGKVEGVNPDLYEVAIYIRVDGGWWTKPTFAEPKTPIASDGTWTCQYATGGNDQSATAIRAYLIPKGFNPPVAKGSTSLPSTLKNNAVVMVEATRQ